MAYLAWVSGIIVGGLGGCCGTIRPRLVGPRCGREMSPADLSDMMPVPLLSSLLECDVKHTRPPCKEFKSKILIFIEVNRQMAVV